jgi:hypothetical protein
MAPIPDSAAACALCQWPKTMTFEGEQLSKWVIFKAIFGYIPCVLRGFLQKAAAGAARSGVWLVCLSQLIGTLTSRLLLCG